MLRSARPHARVTAAQASRYEGLAGDGFLDAAFVMRDLPIIDGLWRVGETTLAVRLAPRIIALDVPTMTDLLLDEILDGSGVEALAAAIADSLTPGRPALTPTAVDRLVARLGDDAPLPAGYQQRRPILACWALGQAGPSVDQFARAVATAQVSITDPSVRLAAYDRARASKRLAANMAGGLDAQLRETVDTTTWPRSFDFVNSVLGDVAPSSPKVASLVSTVLRFAPTYFGNPDLGHPFSDLAVAHAIATLEEMVSGASLSGPGAPAVIRLVDQVPEPGARRRLFLLAMTNQGHHYPVPDQISTWTIDDWRFRLDALVETEGGRPPNAASLMSQAPEELAPRIIALGAKYDHATDPTIESTVVTKVKARLAQVDPADVESIADACWWPSSVEDADGLGYTEVLLEGLGDPTARLAVVAAGLVTGRLAPELAPRLLSTAQSAELWHRPEWTSDLTRRVVPALYDERPEEVFNAVRSNQGAGFSIDLAAAVASRSPTAAFEGAAAGYDGLDDAGRDELLSLLEAHASADQEPVVARFASDSNPGARPRRVRGIALAGELLPKGGTVPTYLSDALSVSHRPIQDAALGAVETAQPRDAEMARRLRGIAAGDGNAAGGARKTLDGLTSAYLDDLTGHIDHQRRRETLGLLGATARRESIPALLDHVGENTPEDDPLVHRSAAEALAEAAAHQKFEPDEVDRLGRLIDEEGDTAARQSLNDALARAVLGEGAAINVLYDDLLGRQPVGNHSADALFGAEKAALVRALTLYHNDASQGEKGWPGVLQQLDLAAEKLARAGYRFVGTSQSIKDQIAADPRKPDYGSILSSLQGKLAKAEAPLTTLHLLRSSHTEYSHSGQKPTLANMTTARDCFRLGALILVGVLEQNA